MQDQDAPTKEPEKTMSQKASELFGNQYVGEVTEAAPIEASEEVYEEVSEDAPITDDIEAGLLETDETELPVESEETEELEAQENESSEVEEIPISSVQELIETNEYDPEWSN